MNELNPPLPSSVRACVGLLSSVIAACTGIAQDGLVTVGIRPTQGSAAISGTGGLPSSEPAAMNPMPTDINSVIPVPPAAGAVSALAGSIAQPMAEGGAGAGAGGAGGSPGQRADECGVIPEQPAGAVTSGWLNRQALVEYDITAPNSLIGLRTTLAVPAKPPATGQVFIWAGIQPTPSGASFLPIGNGALLGELAWGPSCAADSPRDYATWWTAPSYSNLSTSDPQYSGCHVGKVALTEPKQFLQIEIRADGTKWRQTIVNLDTLESSDFSMDLKGQEQGRAIFDISLQTSNKPTEDVVFTHTVLSLARAEPDACRPVTRGMNDFASRPRVSSDGKYCCIDRIVLRAPGVAATTANPP